MEKKKRKLKIALIIVLCVVISFLTIIPFVGGIIAYESAFERCKTSEALFLTTDDFDGLKCENCTFTSNKKLKLAGYKLYNTQYGGSFSEAAKNAVAVVVIAHGMGGGGFNSYMNAADWFASHGYVVFGYDVTGNDNSEGKNIGGLPRGVADLSSAIEFVESDLATKNLPVVLWGHSWGAYSVSNVLNEHPEVKAIAAISGMNKSEDMIFEVGKNIAGEAGMGALLPYMMFYEKMKFGKYSSFTAMDGFKNTNANIMIVHSADDNTVPIKYGYDLYYKEFASNPRFIFVRYENKGHDKVYHSDAALKYVEEFNAQFAKDFNITAETKRVDPEKKTAYIKANLDKKKLMKLMKNFFCRLIRCTKIHSTTSCTKLKERIRRKYDAEVYSIVTDEDIEEYIARG